MSELIVTKSNSLVEASYRLNEVELRLISLAIVKARGFTDSVEQLRGKLITIRASDYMEWFGGTRQGAYKALKDAVFGLFNAKWGYRFTNKKNQIEVCYERFTQSAHYVENDGAVRFMFADAIIPFLVGLEQNFTRYSGKYIAKLKSRYSIRLLEMLMQFKKTKVLYITVDELRFRFNLKESEYKSNSDLKRYLFDKAIKELNEKTDLSITYKQHKEGRNIVGFTINFQEIKPDTANDGSKKDDDVTPRNDAERAIFAQKTEYAEQNGYSELHKNNLIKQALERHRLAEQERLQREQEEKQAKKDKKSAELAELEKAKKIYERILSDEILIDEYIIRNIRPNLLRGLQHMMYKQENYVEVFRLEKRKFNNINDFKCLDLSFL